MSGRVDRRTFLRQVATVGMGLTAAATGCVGERQGPQPGPGVSKVAADSLRFAYQPTTHHIAAIVAWEKGWWLDALQPLGISKIEGKLFTSGETEMQAMVVSEIDMAYVGLAAPTAAIANGLDARIVASVQALGSVLCISPDIPYDGPGTAREEPSVLVGRRFAVPPPGSVDHTAFSQWLRQNRLDDQVQLITRSVPQAIANLQNRTIDGHWAPEPAGAQSEFHRAGKVVLTSGDAMKDHACCYMLASGSLIRDQRRVAERLVETHITTTRWVWDNLEEASDIAANHLKLPADSLKHAVVSYRAPYTYDPGARLESALLFAKTAFDSRLISKEVTEKDLFDFSPYQRVSTRLGISAQQAAQEEQAAAKNAAQRYARLRQEEKARGIELPTVRSDV